VSSSALILAGLAGALVVLLAGAFLRGRFRAKSALVAESDRRFQATFEQAAVGMAHLDRDGRWTRINARFCGLIGYSREELMAMTIDDIIHPLDREGDRALRRDLLAGEVEMTAAEKRYVRKDGRVIWVHVTRSAVRDAAGRPDFFISVVEEITPRKEAEARLVSGEAQYRAIFDSAVEAIAVIDADGIVQSVNRSVERVFGYGAEELVGRNIKLLMPEAIARDHDAYLARYRRTGEKAIIGIGREVIGQRRDGSHFPLDLSVAEWERDGERFFTGVMRDVSARQQAEAALRASEDNLRGLQNEFAHLARVNDLGEMAAAIAHEINQPLTAIVNFLNTGLYMTADGTTDARALEPLMQQASDQALRAGEIVRRLREFIGQGGGERRPEAAGRLIDSAMALALLDARSNGVTVERAAVPEELLVAVDAIQIQQVLANLMRNAVDAMLGAPREGEVPTLRISAAPASGDRVAFAVADNGPGIPDEIADRLFDPFVTTKANGMGMGLSLCRRLVEAHDGSIAVESVPGRGASFTFYLPLYRPVLH